MISFEKQVLPTTCGQRPLRQPPTIPASPYSHPSNPAPLESRLAARPFILGEAFLRQPWGEDHRAWLRDLQSNHRSEPGSRSSSCRYASLLEPSLPPAESQEEKSAHQPEGSAGGATQSQLRGGSPEGPRQLSQSHPGSRYFWSNILLTQPSGQQREAFFPSN